MSRLLSRYAEAIYWMARYIERAENLARVLDVNETFSRDSRGWQNWQSILQLYRDEERFFKNNERADADSVLYFYTLDQTNPTSIISVVNAARANARTLRPLISTEMWIQLNIFSNTLKSLKREELTEPRLARFCNTVKETCQTHTGITEGTFYRDEGWFFYQIGRCIERADQTTRLLDVKYHLLLPNDETVGSPFDVSQWNAVLRSAAGYHAFRRVYPSGLSQTEVAGFLLFHSQFPRSVKACIREIDDRLTELRSTYRLRGGGRALEELDELCAVLDDMTVQEVVNKGLHEFIDWIQIKLINIHSELGTAYFGDPPFLESDAAQ
ncbi:alpha-E domain-containing protein [Pelagibius litoralis]|uniref:Alpha-E domain-containing protein n=1 Tax=Pelagibius litoralis TaxID=374515 RepID=A0A967EWI4_9PROT|nr:alpha-E domain-containing protein [Pelagibius litoralis]NIA67008.1 alpha-E domain-containing protein [Pelagibius litoralis]